MSRASEVTRLDVYRGPHLAGRLVRTDSGCRFEPTEVSLAGEVPASVGFRIGKEPVEVQGVNLPAFFANLLPEGLRFAALVGRVRTSVDDLFSLLAEVGEDCVGDVSAVPVGQEVRPPSEEIALHAENVDFEDVAVRLRREAGRTGIPGVQLKLSASMVTLPTHDRVGLLKLEPPEYPNLPANEAACMARAKRAGIEVAAVRIVRDRLGRSALYARRFDRVVRRGRVIGRVHVEDGCQLCDRYPADKYRLSLRDIASAIADFSSSPKREILRLLQLHAFSYLFGNSDLHAKNVSLWVRPGTRIVELCPAYDLVCTVVFPNLRPNMALMIEGRDENLRVHEFVTFASRFGLPPEAVRSSLRVVLAATEGWTEEIESFAPSKGDAQRAAALLAKRRSRLEV